MHKKLFVAIQIIDIASLNAGLALYNLLRQRGHTGYFIVSSFGGIGAMRERLPADADVVWLNTGRVSIARKLRMEANLQKEHLRVKEYKGRKSLRPLFVAGGLIGAVVTGSKLYQKIYIYLWSKQSYHDWVAKYRQWKIDFLEPLKIKLDGYRSLSPRNIMRYLTFSAKTRPLVSYWTQHKYISDLTLFFDHGIARKRERSNSVTHLKKKKPDAVILMNDIESTLTVPVYKACQISNIPVYLCCYGFPIPKAVYARNLVQKAYHIDTLLKRIFAFFFSKYTFTQTNVKLFYSPFPETLANLAGRFSIPRPWYPHSSKFSAVFLPSKYFRDQYVGFQYDLKTFHTTGTATHDYLFDLFSKQKPALLEQLKQLKEFEPQKQVLSVNIGIDNFGERDTELFENWTIYAAYKVKILKRLAQKYNILLSFHPKMTEDEMKPFVEGSFCLAPFSVQEVLAVSDLFLSYSGSSVVPESIVAHVPIVVFDVYGFRYDFTKDETGIRVFCDIESFEEMTTKILEMENILPLFDMDNGNKNNSRGVLDGRAAERIEQAIFDTYK